MTVTLSITYRVPALITCLYAAGTTYLSDLCLQINMAHDYINTSYNTKRNRLLPVTVYYSLLVCICNTSNLLTARIFSHCKLLLIGTLSQSTLFAVYYLFWTYSTITMFRSYSTIL